MLRKFIRPAFLIAGFAASSAAASPFTPGERARFSDGKEEYAIEVIGVREDGMVGIRQSWSARPPLLSWQAPRDIEASLIAFSKASAERYLEKCEELGGRRELITTPAGAFPSCTFYAGKFREEYSVSPAAPLGFVRLFPTGVESTAPFSRASY